VRRRILLVVAVLVLLVAGAGVAYFLKSRERPGGKLDTKLSGVTASVATNVAVPTQPKKKGRYHLVDDKRCWDNFGGDPARTLSRPGLDIGLPLRHFWVVGLGSYIEYPPSYCSGILYVNCRPRLAQRAQDLAALRRQEALDAGDRRPAADRQLA
jgi:hypothetical protein